MQLLGHLHRGCRTIALVHKSTIFFIVRCWTRNDSSRLRGALCKQVRFAIGSLASTCLGKIERAERAAQCVIIPLPGGKLATPGSMDV